MSDPVRGVVVAHADLARALIQAVDRIAGVEEDALVPLSNEGLRPSDIGDRLEEVSASGPTIFFTDLREGSCGLAARRACFSRPDHVLVTGVNLPMLLDFVLNRHRPLEELVDRAVERGQQSIQRMPERDPS